MALSVHQFIEDLISFLGTCKVSSNKYCISLIMELVHVTKISETTCRVSLRVSVCYFICAVKLYNDKGLLVYQHR